MLFLKNRSEFQTYQQMDEKSYELYTDSYEEESSQAVLKAGEADQDDAQSWLIWNGRVFYVTDVSVDDTECTLGLSEGIKIFDRDVVYDGLMAVRTSTSEFIETLIRQEWVEQSDGDYAYPYLQISNWLGSTDPELIRPEEVKEAQEDEDSTGAIVFNVYEYFQMLREAYNVRVDLILSGNGLVATIYQPVKNYYNVIFGDGDSILESQSFGEADTTAKVTVLVEDTENGTCDSFTYYLDSEGEMSDEGVVPESRMAGKWAIVTTSVDEDRTNAEIAKEEAEREFGENSGSMKIEFWCSRRFELGDVITMRLNKKAIKGRVSSIAKRSDNTRWFYTVGDLATSLTDKLKRKG